MLQISITHSSLTRHTMFPLALTGACADHERDSHREWILPSVLTRKLSADTEPAAKRLIEMHFRVHRRWTKKLFEKIKHYNKRVFFKWTQQGLKNTPNKQQQNKHKTQTLKDYSRRVKLPRLCFQLCHWFAVLGFGLASDSTLFAVVSPKL